MAYTSAIFWPFLALVLAGVALLPRRFRLAWLIAVSLWFYGTGDPIRLLWLGGIAALALAAAGGTRLWRGVGIAALLELLVWAKFADTLGLPDPDAPPGLSFLVLTAIALVADSAGPGAAGGIAGRVLHLAWFPKLLAGPIERAGHLIPQFPQIALRPGLARLGLALLISGLVKKLVIADALAPVVDAAYGVPAYATPVDLLVASYFFAFQIYCDFSGYTDIALGLSALVGLRLSRNFAHPYFSPTVGEFWSSRWHITLGHWFRDYVYIPLGGSRHGRARQAANVMAVFLLSGLWHAGLGYGVGWGFVVWGALNGLFVIAELWLPAPQGRTSRLLRGLLTFHLILLTWVFFRAATPAEALVILGRIAGALPDLPHLLPAYPFSAEQQLGAVPILGLLAAGILTGRIPLAERIAAAPLPLRWGGLYAGLAALLLMGRWQATGFIYAGF
ncbi:MBOAT family O-acyltransferase [Oceaniglobus roseus]|uniref:MBOAT family O-acyltransferase n=1 Tax=Oceaniglobus roseus TaxID=1737570 RepID=UPI000C7F5B28|nr:MBOAT family O-acyltransferase [Kandeliimicrobium roseum]